MLQYKRMTQKRIEIISRLKTILHLIGVVSIASPAINCLQIMFANTGLVDLQLLNFLQQLLNRLSRLDFNRGF